MRDVLTDLDVNMPMERMTSRMPFTPAGTAEMPSIATSFLYGEL